MASPDVHIVVPTTGQRLDLLDVCIASLLAQTLVPRISLVTRDAVDAVHERYGGAATVLQQARPGLSAAINSGWEADDWSSQFTGWLGDDDALPPTSIETAVGALTRSPTASMVHGRCLVVDGDGEPVRVVRNGVLAARFAGYGVNLLAQPGTLFRTSAVRAVGGLDETYSLAMDVELFLRLKQLGPIVTSSQQLGVFREHTSGLSTDHKLRAANEARRAQERLHTRSRDRALDAAAQLTTRLVSRMTRAMPPGYNSYWRPAGPGARG